MPKYYPINEEAARRAKNANSFSDYVPGSATAAYREMVGDNQPQINNPKWLRHRRLP